MKELVSRRKRTLLASWFHALGAATRNARSPNRSLVRGVSAECLSLPTEEQFVVMWQRRQVEGGRWCTQVLSRREHGVLTVTVCTECELRQVANGARSPPGWRGRGTVGQTRVWRLHWRRAGTAPLTCGAVLPTARCRSRASSGLARQRGSK